MSRSRDDHSPAKSDRKSLTGEQLFAVLSVVVVAVTAEAGWRVSQMSDSPFSAAEILFSAMAVFTIGSFMVSTTNLRRNSRELQHRVDERTRELRETMAGLEAAKEAADEANRMKSEFLANVSHELRTPLHGMLSYARFGSNESATAEPDELAEYFQKIERSGDSLLRMVNDLLDLAKFEAGMMSLDRAPADLGSLAAFVVDEFNSLCSERDIQIQLDVPEADYTMPLDADRLKQVIRNLLSNAVKFSPAGSTVRLTVTQTGDVLATTVWDEGPGVPDDELEAVFEKFVQSSRTKTGAGGTGLGLAICREIVEGHGGQIWAENAPEGGAIFAFELPYQPAAVLACQPVAAGAA